MRIEPRELVPKDWAELGRGGSPGDREVSGPAPSRPPPMFFLAHDFATPRYALRWRLPAVADPSENLKPPASSLIDRAGDLPCGSEVAQSCHMLPAQAFRYVNRVSGLITFLAK